MNLGDENQVREQGQKAKLKRENELSDVRKVLSIPEGRRFFWKYLDFCGVFRISHHASGSQTAFNEGGRNVGLRLLADVNEAEPEKYLVMMKEAKDAERNETAPKNTVKKKEIDSDG